MVKSRNGFIIASEKSPVRNEYRPYAVEFRSCIPESNLIILDGIVRISELYFIHG